MGTIMAHFGKGREGSTPALVQFKGVESLEILHINIHHQVDYNMAKEFNTRNEEKYLWREPAGISTLGVGYISTRYLQPM